MSSLGADNPVDRGVVFAVTTEILPPATTLLVAGAPSCDSRSKTEILPRGFSAAGRGAGRCARWVAASVSWGLLAFPSTFQPFVGMAVVLSTMAGKSTLSNWMVAPAFPISMLAFASWILAPCPSWTIIGVFCRSICINERNYVKYDKGNESATITAAKIISYMAIVHKDRIIVENLGNWDINQPPRLSKLWYPPPPNWLKINIDGSLHNSYIAGVGGVIRDWKGRFLMAFGCGYVQWDIAQVELLAFRSLRRFLKKWMLEANGIIIEGDNLNVIKFLQNVYSNPNKDWDQSIGEDILFLKDLNKILFKVVNRNCNELAIYCANLACDFDFFWEDISDNNIPPSFVLLLNEECDCLTLF
ncbi:hypothetical protein IEQ34_016929 [Dendrobium chrysotoxum]|uniref:RNase H type-1 domain-containing protein n=1 Tax=Dendrobium chrysotoxum TaxID=161865 RepID=A0AAV7GFM4_DENCH|nr:hypothetical protein IEQ34_016929 [Dendrobium chrysotoxum]